MISARFYALLIREVEHQFDCMNRKIDADMRREGGYFCLAKDERSGPFLPPIIIVMIGNPPCEKAIKYYRLVQEKVNRLLLHPDHLSAAQSADSTKQMFPGAIRACGYVFGYSGFPGADTDETLLLNVLAPNFWFGTEYIAPEQSDLNQIVSASGNKMYK